MSPPSSTPRPWPIPDKRSKTTKKHRLHKRFKNWIKKYNKNWKRMHPILYHSFFSSFLSLKNQQKVWTKSKRFKKESLKSVQVFLKEQTNISFDCKGKTSEGKFKTIHIILLNKTKILHRVNQSDSSPSKNAQVIKDWITCN